MTNREIPQLFLRENTHAQDSYKMKPVKNPSIDEGGDHRILALPENLLEINGA